MINIYIRPIPGSIASEIFILDEPERFSPQNVNAYFNFNEKGESIITAKPIPTLGEAINVKPTMVLEENDLRGIIEAFSGLARRRGLKSPDESFSSGKLEATEKHLEDMRAIAFKKK